MEFNKINGQSFDIVEDNVNKLKELFPEIVNGDNQVDFDALRDLFEKNDDYFTDDEEHYKFTWWGKKEAKELIKEKTTKTLRPIFKDNWNSTNNIYIEGDNLDAIKVLLGSYRNSIKMIYIDPPYNTGKDFVYKDKFDETDEDYLKKTNQMDEDGYLYENPKTDGKYHSNWLNMMYPRLYLARKLLTDDGIIYISINDEEETNLKKICDEIFGERNFVTKIIWTNKEGGGSSDSKLFKIKHEYILAYSKNINLVKIKGIPVTDADRYKGEDEYLSTRGPYQLIKLDSASLGYVSSLDYPIEAPDGKLVLPNKDGEKVSRWRWSESKLQWGKENGYVEFKKNNQNEWNVYTKQYLNADNEGNIITRTNRPVPIIDKYSSTKASKYLQKLFGKKVFDYSKPYELIKFLIELSVEDNDIVLDFFSGSATTAESLLRYNAENSLNNQFIMVQYPEITKEKSNAFKAGFNNICEIGEKRIELAGDEIINETNNENLDVTFKLFKIDESNFIPWNSKLNKDNVKQAILKTANNLVEGRSELDLIYELILKLNLNLNVSIEEKTLKNENKNKIFIIENGFMFVCLDDAINQSITNDLLELKKELKSEYSQVILKDSSLSDECSININENLKAEGVNFYTI